MNQVDWIGTAAVATMYAAFLAIGWVASRKVREGTASELMIAGRNMPLWIATLTMTATWVDGGYLLGTAELTYQHSLAAGLQGGVCFGLSLVLGGLFFAKTMRRLEFSTLVDPFEVRFGPRWAAVLFVPALLGELFWSGALLLAIGATFKELLHVDQTTAVLISAAVVTGYTMVGGMWSVAYTDIFQLALISLGLLIALPFALDHVGGLDACVQTYLAGKQEAALLMPPLVAHPPTWTMPQIVAWWDMSIMLILGGIPWNCYFQRVLACQSPEKARWHSIIAGVLTIALTVPPLLLGMAAYANWPEGQIDAKSALPLVLQKMTPHPVMILGLAAIIGAVTSSFSSSILSAGSMFGWNVYRRLIAPAASVDRLQRVIRALIVVLGVLAVFMALAVDSVAELWLFTGDLVFVLLFPQLLCALFDPKVNRIGSMTALAVSLALRLGGGIAVFGWRPIVPYPELFAAWLPGEPADWYDAAGATLFPVKTLSALAGLVLLPVVSRLTARWDPPRPLERNHEKP